MTYQLGRLPAVRPAALSDLQTYATGRLPSPPALVKVPSTSYPIMGNDQYGDCTIAGVGHLIAAWDVDTKVHDAVPSEKAVIDEYFKLSGGEDTGLVEADVLRTWHTQGLFGHKIAGYAPVPPRNTLALHQSVAFYEGCYLGIECPRSMQEQFAEGIPITYVAGSPIEGGHCIVALGYDQHYVYCATWGKIVPVGYGFLAHYLQESWAIISHQLATKKVDTLGIDLAQLQADLTKV